MFDQHAKALFTDFPEFEGLFADESVRTLSQAYLAVLEYRINSSISDLEGLANVQSFLRRLANTLIFHVVLDEGREENARQAAAFVAAEAIALMADYLEIASTIDKEISESHIRSSERYPQLYYPVIRQMYFTIFQYSVCHD